MRYSMLVPMLFSCMSTPPISSGSDKGEPPPTETAEEITEETTTPTGGTMTWDGSCSPSTTTELETGLLDSGFYEYGPPTRDVLRVYSGPDLLAGVALEISASTVVMGWDCDLPDIPNPPVDFDLDGINDVALRCRQSASGSDNFLQLLSGASALTGATQTLGCLYGEDINSIYHHGVLGDLDGDKVSELSIHPWNADRYADILASSTLPGRSDVTATWTISGDSLEYPDYAPVDAGDVDGDGVPDLVIPRDGSANESSLVFVSGAGLVSLLPGSDLSTITDAIAIVGGGAGFGEMRLAMRAGDVDGDGLEDLLYTLAPSGSHPAEARVVLASSLPSAGFGDSVVIRGSIANNHRMVAVARAGDLDVDGLADVAVMLTTYSSSLDEQTEIAVIPGADLAAAGPGGVVPAGLLALTGTDPEPREMFACDLDGDGRVELITPSEIWRGTDLLTPGAASVEAPAYLYASWCGGDMDGLPGEEVVQLDFGY